MEKYRKLELIQRSLGIRHKLKVHDSMKAPDTHEDLAMMLMSKWELEDELRAIEEILSDVRQANVASRKSVLLRIDAEKLIENEARRKLLDKPFVQPIALTSAANEQYE